MIKKIELLLIAFFIMTNLSFSQDADSTMGVKRTGGTYANLFRFEFKPGKTDEGLEILKSSLIPAYKSAGVKITIIEDLLGTKDVLAIIELKDGPSFYDYVLPKQDKLLFKALIKQSGSEKEAERKLDKFVNLLVRETQTLIYVHKPE